MAFKRPTREKLVARAKADIMSRLDGADANLRGSPEEVLAIVLAGMAHELHGHLKWESKQLLPDLSDDEFLLRDAADYAITPTAAVKAQLSVTISGTNASVCPAGTVWARTDSVAYTQNADATISSGTATITVTAETAGADGNADATTPLSIGGPVTGINSGATVASTVVDGVDQQATDQVRTRLLARLQSPPKGGGPGDYETWALEVAGVTRAWQYPNQLGLGTVVVVFVVDDLGIIPDAAEILAVQTHLDGKRPVTATVTAAAPIEHQLNPHIQLDPDTADIRAAVQAEIEDLLNRVAEPGDGSSRGTVLLSQLNEAISIAQGEFDHTLVSPVANVVPADLELVTLGTINWS